MKINQLFYKDIERYKDYVMIVEGKKDLAALKALGFQKVYMIHEPGMPIKVRLEQIAQQIEKRDKVCILTDFDKKGKNLYMLIKQIAQELGMHVDSSFRGLLLKGKISHIEGLYTILKKEN